MGEIADLMLEGSICEGCGVEMGEACGFVRRCAGCAADARKAGSSVRPTGLGGFQVLGRAAPAATKVSCAVCKKRVKKLGLNDHMRDVHDARIGKAGQHAEIRALLAEWLRDHDEFGGAHADTFTARVRAALANRT